MVKAKIAQILLYSTWQQTTQQANTVAQPPWSSADFHPIAKLTFVGFDTSYIVLNTDSGQALAFAPGVTAANTIKNSEINIISAHNDSHFKILERLSIGDKILLETQQGIVNEYRVDKINVQDLRVSRHLMLDNSMNQLLGDTLLLVTCYPFSAAIEPTPYRYLVYATRIQR